MSHNSSELMCGDDPNGTTLQGVCETSEIYSVGRWGCSDMRLKGVASPWLGACLKDIMMQRRRWWLTACLGCWVVKWVVLGLTRILGLGEAKGKSAAGGVSGKTLRFVGGVLLQGGGKLGWVFRATWWHTSLICSIVERTSCKISRSLSSCLLGQLPVWCDLHVFRCSSRSHDQCKTTKTKRPFRGSRTDA